MRVTYILCSLLICELCVAVIATLGPACRDVDTLVSLLESGLAAARVDLTVRIYATPSFICTFTLLRVGTSTL